MLHASEFTRMSLKGNGRALSAGTAATIASILVQGQRYFEMVLQGGQGSSTQSFSFGLSPPLA
jgi:hypothetical protein